MARRPTKPGLAFRWNVPATGEPRAHVTVTFSVGLEDLLGAVGRRQADPASWPDVPDRWTRGTVAAAVRSDLEAGGAGNAGDVNDWWGSATPLQRDLAFEVVLDLYPELAVVPAPVPLRGPA